MTAAQDQVAAAREQVDLARRAGAAAEEQVSIAREQMETAKREAAAAEQSARIAHEELELARDRSRLDAERELERLAKRDPHGRAA